LSQRQQPVWAWLVPAALVLATAIVYWRSGFGWSDVDKRVSPLAVLAVAMTVYVAYYIQRYLGDRSLNLRVEKDILIGRITSLHAVLRQIHEAAFDRYTSPQLGDSSRRNILALFRRGSLEIDDLRSTMQESRCETHIEIVDRVRSEYQELKAAATGGSFPAAPCSQEQLLDQERSYRKVCSTLNSLAMTINRHV